MHTVDDIVAFDGRVTTDPKQRVDLMRRFAIVLLLIGAADAAVGLVVTAETYDARVIHLIAASVFLCSGLLIAALRPRRWLISFSVCVSIINLGVLIAGSNPLGIAPMGYLWPVAFVAFFFPRRTLVTVCVLATVSLAVSLFINHDHHLKLDTFIGATTSIYVVAGLMSSMNRREEELRAELERHAGTDPLTGLLNRRGFDPLVRTMIAAAAFTPQPDLSFVMFDLDHFKQFNDLHGHITGDDALRRVATTLVRQCGSRDAICRFGGEEFAVAMPGADRDNAVAYAHRVAAALRREGAPGWNLSVSAGISTMADGDDAVALITRADAALYAAKDNGRDRAAWWETAIVIGPQFTLADNIGT